MLKKIKPKHLAKMLSALVTAALMLSLATACQSDHSLKRIRQKGFLNIGYASCDASTDAPFLIGEKDGITADPAIKTAKSLDTSAVFTRLSSRQAYDKLLNGEVDCLWNVMPPSKETVASVRTVETGIYYRQVIMTTADSPITRLADVSGKVMAVVSGSDAQTELHNAAVMESSLRQIKPYQTFSELLEALSSGSADCAAVDEPQALYYMKQNEGKFQLINTPLAETALVIATRTEDAELCTKIADKYVKLAQNGEIRSLCQTYADGSLNAPMQTGNSAV